MVEGEACDEEAVCYLCLDGGADDDGQPLRRDCACRGTDAGFVHLSCLTDYAETKSKSWDGRDMNLFIQPWAACPSCHQKYQNELSISISTAFVLFVRRQYPRNTQLHVEALYMKLGALKSMYIRAHIVQKIELRVTANVLLSLIDRMKGDAPSLPRRYSSFAANAYHVHGRIAFDEGTEESARRAVTHFENQLKVCKATGDTDGIAAAKSNIARARSKYEGNNDEEVLKACQELYELRVAEYGENDEQTIISGKIYAINLQKASRGDESRTLLFKLLATSKQALGSHHNTTKEVASALKWNRGIAFISSILCVFILIVVLAVVCQLAKKMRFVTLDRWVEVSIYLLFGFYMLYCILTETVII